MTHFSDGLELGGAVTNPVIGSTGGFGYKSRQSVILEITPAALNASALATSQSLTAAGSLTLTAGTSVTQTTLFGATAYQLDAARCVTITSAGNDSGITFTVSGYDQYKQTMTATVTGASAAAATTLKAFQYVTSITSSGSSASTVTAGTSNTFGLPIALAQKAYISSAGFGTSYSDNGTFVVADTTATATALTGDVRGTYAPTGTPNGSSRLIVEILTSTAQNGSGSAATTAILGVTQA